MSALGTGDVRGDLLALDAEMLAAMVNRGLVKRARKDLESGAGPRVESGTEGGGEVGLVRGFFPDGAEACFPPGAGLDASLCSCAASGICRHRICLVFAYQQAYAEEVGEQGSGLAAVEAGVVGTSAGWSPGDIDDESLAALVGARPLAAARRIFERGYTARVHRVVAQDAVGEPADASVPWVELPACTVRFPVPGNVAHVITDVAVARRGEAIALAVWAFRAADASGGGESQVRIEVGGSGGGSDVHVPRAFAEALDLTVDLIVDGGANVDPVLDVTLRRIQRGLVDAGLHWPASAFGELGDQLEAYRLRNAEYQHTTFARSIAELHARHRVLGRTAVPTADVLGTGESESVPLRRIRLTALGARVRGTDSQRIVEVYFAQPRAGLALVLKRRWKLDPADAAESASLTGHVLSARRLLGTTLGALATANLVSETATRSPSRVLTVSSSRVAPTSVLPLGAAWSELPAPVLVGDFQRFAGSLRQLPPTFLRPRIEAEAVHVLQVAEVVEIGYNPADQCLRAEILDEHGAPAMLTASYNPICPGALDALADVLRAGPSQISGTLSVAHGRLAIDPIAVRSDQGVTVLDFAPGDGADALDAAARAEQPPIVAAIAGGLGALAELASAGLRQSGRAGVAALEEAAAQLARTGLADCAQLVRRIPLVLSKSGYRAAATCWIDAFIHLSVAAELIAT